MSLIEERVVGSEGSSGGELSDLSGSAGQGLSLAVLGGYRSAVANFVWLDMNGSWERREFDETLSRIVLATTIDPRPEIFWLNGSRVIANDMPFWGNEEERRHNPLMRGSTEEIQRRFALRAIELLEQARMFHPTNTVFIVEQAMICWRKLDDLEMAAELFREATSRDGAPYYCFRIYAELLLKLGRESEALSFLIAHYESLPDDDIQAMKPVVAARIDELRRSLD